MRKDPIVIIGDIIESIDAICSHIKGLNKRDFLSLDNIPETIKTQDAVIRRIGVIGEAAKNIPASIMKKYSDVEWKKIIGMRDRLVHKYYEIDLNLTWEVITKDIKVLKKQMLEIKKDFEKS
jgi:uncharacterized protein with HEPN domain